MSAEAQLKSQVTMRVYAVKVRTRGEEPIAAVLREKGYEVLAPSYNELRQYSDRTRRMRSALFPGYIFVRMDPRNMLRLVSTEGVSYIVRSGAALHPLSLDETHTIEALCRLAGSDVCEPCSYLRVGQRVRIEAGPLVGLEGVLTRVREVEHVVISVESLHRSVSVVIGHTGIRVLEQSSEALAG